MTDSVTRIRERAHQLRVYAAPVMEDIINEPEGVSEVPDDSPSTYSAANDRPATVNHETVDPVDSMRLPPIPKLKGVDDDTLRNLLMSWFYTGYYTGKAEAESATSR